METNFETKAALVAWAVDQTATELVNTYNRIPVVEPADAFASREDAADKIWAAMHPKAKDKKAKATVVLAGTDGPAQAEIVEPSALAAAKPTAPATKAQRAARKAKVAPIAKVPAKKAAKPARPAKKAKRAKAAPAPRKDSNKAEAIRMLQRANGATLAELMKKFSWLPHTTRGFISILGKDHKVTSEKVDGVRTYKVR